MPTDRARRPVARPASALLAVLLASCTAATPDAARSPDLAMPGVCRVGPDGGPLPAASRTADRGIGGTGAPVRQADRGIGGTGAPVRQAEQGIGGTGIVAVITGFASVCLAGQEVSLDSGVPVLIGDRPATPEALRVGQVAVIDAAGTGQALRARAIAVRYEVSGPVEMNDGTTLHVVGQRVAVSAGTLGDRPARGEWVAVSGLRRPDGVVEATRLDRRTPGDVVVRGRLARAGASWRIGTLPVHLRPGMLASEGQDMTVLGIVDRGVLQAEQLVPDLLASNPTALFGVGVQGLLIESFATVEGGRMRFGQGFSAAAPGLDEIGLRRSVLELRPVVGGLRAVGIEASKFTDASSRGSAAPVPTRQFEPAPMPNRVLGPRGAAARAGRGNTGGPGGPPGRRSEQNGSALPGEGPGNVATSGAGGGPGFGPAAAGGFGGPGGRR